MKQLDEKVRALFESQKLWYMGTSGTDADVSVIGFRELEEDGRMVLCDVFMNEALANIRKTGRASVLAARADTMESYIVSGRAEYLTAGPEFEAWKKKSAAATNGRLNAKGVVIVTPDTVRVKTPGPDNGKII